MKILGDGLDSYNKYANILFILLFVLSGFYAIPYLDVNIGFFVEVKRLVYVVLILLMGLSVNWKEARVNALFILGCIIWGTVVTVQWGALQVYSGIHLTRLVQLVFVLFAVFFVSTHRSYISYLVSVLRPAYIGAAVLALVLFSFVDEFKAQLNSGFGGNRGNFSIWLTQFTFLALASLFVAEKISKKLFYAVIFAVIALLFLQVFAGGRIGLAVTGLLFVYASWMLMRFRGAFLSIAFLGLTISVASYASPTRGVYPAMSIVRQTDIIRSINKSGYEAVVDRTPNSGLLDKSGNLAVGKKSILGRFYYAADRFTTYRVRLFLMGLDEVVRGRYLLRGKGFDRFVAYTPYTGVVAVHNVYLMAIGELGVFGLLAYALIVLPVFIIKAHTSLALFAKVYTILMFGVGMFQPELLLTNIGMSIMFWVCYSCVVSHSYQIGYSDIVALFFGEKS